MSTLQTLQLWIGFGFVLLLVIFLMVAYFKGAELNDGQRRILRFLCALCAGFAGALITGEALFQFDTQVNATTRIAASGTAGFALFFAIWFTFDRTVPLPPGVSINVPNGWTFSHAVEAVVASVTENKIANFDGFQDAELAALLRPGQISRDTVPELLLALRLLAPNNAIRPYTVSFEDPLYRLSIST